MTRKPFLLCYGAMMALAVAFNFAPAYLTTFAEVFGGPDGLNEEQLGRISAVAFAAAILGVAITGPLADRFGAKLFVLLGLGFVAAGLGLLSAARQYWALLTAVAVMGLGAGILDLIVSPVVCALARDRRTQAMNALHAFYGVGAVATVTIGMGAIAADIPWRLVALLMAILPLGLLAGFWSLEVPSLVREGDQRTRARSLARHPFLLCALAAIFLGGAAEQGMTQWLPAFTERIMGFTKEAGAGVLVGFLIAMSAGRAAASRIGARVAPATLLLGSAVSTFALIVVACASSHAPIALGASILTGATVSCMWPTILAMAGDRFPRGGASMFGILSLTGHAGCLAMPWIIGAVAAETDLRTGLGITALCPAGMALVLVCMRWLPSPESDEV